IVRFLQHDRIIRSDLIELFFRKWFLVVGELVTAPAAERVDPLPGSGGPDFCAQHLDRLLARLHAVETHFFGPGFTGPHEVRMVVDQSWNDGALPEIDPASAAPSELGYFLVGADSDD